VERRATDSLNEILDYYGEKFGFDVADNVYQKILKDVELLSVEEGRTQLCLDTIY
jgi:plasmid stabilization system protein ParE